MRRCLVFLCLFSLLLCLVSCQTTGTVDISPIVNPMLEMRPDNSILQIRTDIVDVYDVVENSTQYLMAWEMWQRYAEALEKTIHDIEDFVEGS